MSVAPSASERLAEFADALVIERLPAAVVHAVRRHVLDTLGVALAAGPAEFAAAARAGMAALTGGGAGTVWGQHTGLPHVWAALINGTAAHGLDYDDTHAESVVHVSASVVPAAFAMAEATGCDGARLVASIALGMESAIRIGLVARGGFHDRGFHPTGICGSFAAALLSARLLGLTPDRIAHALGIAGSQAAGSLEFLTDGTWAKRLHGGWAAHAGITAAHLAAAGFTGPRTIFEGRFGLYRSHLGGGEWDLTPLTSQLGSHWELLQTSLKPYPCCHMNHAFLDAVATLRTRYRFEPADVAAVECRIAAREAPIVCEPEATKRTPQTDYDAKFSLPYTVACMLIRGHVEVDDFTPAAIRDAAVLSLAQRVRYGDDPESDYPRHFPGRLRIHLRNGTVLEHAEPVHRGSPDRPLSDDEVCDKFTRNARRSLTERNAAAVAEMIWQLESLADVRAVAAALRGDA